MESRDPSLGHFCNLSRIACYLLICKEGKLRKEEEAKEKGGELNFLCGCTSNSGGYPVFQLRSIYPRSQSMSALRLASSMGSYNYAVLVKEVNITILNY